MKEKTKNNLCDKDGFCGALCEEDQRGCRFFAAAKTLFPGQCVHRQPPQGNCMSPEALVTKWKELREGGDNDTGRTN